MRRRIIDFIETYGSNILAISGIIMVFSSTGERWWISLVVMAMVYLYWGERPQQIEEEREIECYMCQIDWQHELGEAMGGNKLYPSEKDLRRNHEMADQCGIVKVKVSLVEVVKEQDLKRANPGDYVDKGKK